MRVPPAVEGPSGMIARALREQPPDLDEVTRARMERTLLQAWRTHAAARVPLPGRPQTPFARAVWAASIAASAVAGGIVAFSVFGGTPQTTLAANVGQFELRIGDAAVQSGSVAEGQVLESGAHGRLDVDLRSARLQMGRDTRLRFDRMSEPDLTLSLLKGRLEVDFHPQHHGEQHMSVESAAARVNVVGTRFVLDVDALGNTEVSVTEGVVEVVPRSGAEVRRVPAGEHVYVRADDGDEYERKVRDAIEQNLRSLDDAPGEPAEPAAAHADMDFTLDDAAALGTAHETLSASTISRKLKAARRLLHQGQHVQARARLRELSGDSVAVRFRVEALTLIAESFTAQGDVPRAAQAYRKASELSPSEAAGHNARFALGRLLERYAHDKSAATEAYRSYLDRAPRGPLAAQARQALCRLGSTQFCRK
jgi:hypothetical protein